MRATPIRQALWLVKNGVPFDVAFALDEAKRTAWSIIFSELGSGKQYNFAARKYEST